MGTPVPAAPGTLLGVSLSVGISLAGSASSLAHHRAWGGWGQTENNRVAQGAKEGGWMLMGREQKLMKTCRSTAGSAEVFWKRH